MSDVIFDQFDSGMAALNTGLQGAFARDGARLFILGKKGQTGQYTSLMEVTAGYYVQWSAFRMQTRFRFAGMGDDFEDVQAQMSAIAYGVPNDDGELDVYPIGTDERDKVRPDGSSPFWKFYGVRKSELRFTIPSP